MPRYTYRQCVKCNYKFNLLMEPPPNIACPHCSSHTEVITDYVAEFPKPAPEQVAVKQPGPVGGRPLTTASIKETAAQMGKPKVKFEDKEPEKKEVEKPPKDKAIKKAPKKKRRSRR